MLYLKGKDFERVDRHIYKEYKERKAVKRRRIINIKKCRNDIKAGRPSVKKATIMWLC